MPTTPRNAWYHIVLFIVGAALTVVAIVCLVLTTIHPEIPNHRTLTLLSTILAAAVIGFTALHRIAYETRQEIKMRPAPRVEDRRDVVDVEARLADLRKEVEELIAAALVDGLRTQEGRSNGAVVPFTRRN